MEKERLQFCIHRFDHFYETVNSKTNSMLLLSTFFTGGLISLYPFFSEKLNETNHLIISFWYLSVLLGLISLILTNWSSIPFLSPCNDQSIYYFGSIAGLNENEFLTKSKEATPEKEVEDLRIQTHRLAKGLYRKFSVLKFAGWLTTIQIVSFVIFAIIFFLNLKQHS